MLADNTKTQTLNNRLQQRIAASGKTNMNINFDSLKAAIKASYLDQQNQTSEWKAPIMYAVPPTPDNETMEQGVIIIYGMDEMVPDAIPMFGLLHQPGFSIPTNVQAGRDALDDYAHSLATHTKDIMEDFVEAKVVMLMAMQQLTYVLQDAAKVFVPVGNVFNEEEKV